MAVQARRFSHDLTAAVRGGGAGPLSLDDCCAGGDSAVLSDLACGGYGFAPRTKRPRLVSLAPPAPGGSGTCFHDHPPAGMECLVPLPPSVDEQKSTARSDATAAASTSGRAADGLLSWAYRHDAEIDALVSLEAERLRAGVEESRRRHGRALLLAAARAASGRLRAAEAGVERALRRGAELEEKARQAGAECQAWMGVARAHEAAAAGLHATLAEVLRSTTPGAEAEDARSCCFEAPAADERPGPCRSCGAAGGARVLLLPCRHLCLCGACEAAVDACPVCGATKNGSLHVLFS